MLVAAVGGGSTNSYLPAPFRSPRSSFFSGWNARTQRMVAAAAASVALLLLLYVATPAGRGDRSGGRGWGGGRSEWSHGWSCTKRPLVLVYNRIPKAGSSTLMALFKELSASLGYRYVTPEPYHDHAKLRRAIFQAISDGEQTLIVNHFWYPEIQYGGMPIAGFDPDLDPRTSTEATETTEATEATDPVVGYINMVREPSDRAISDYYYLRYGSERSADARAAFLRDHGDLSMDDCYFGAVSGANGKSDGKSDGRLAEYEKYRGVCEVARDVQADYFCGREGHRCHEDDDAGRALKARLSVANMVAHYTVGVNERYEETLRMFEATYPAFFEGLAARYRRGLSGERNERNERNENRNRGNVSRALVDRLREENALDMMLWRLAGEGIDAWKRRCDGGGGGGVAVAVGV